MKINEISPINVVNVGRVLIAKLEFFPDLAAFIADRITISVQTKDSIVSNRI